VASRWSAEADDLLRTLYCAGVPVREIARRVGRSEDAVTERRRTLRLAPRPRSQPWSAAEDELLRAAAAAGLPATTLAQRLKRPADQVRRRRAWLVGGGASPRRYSPAEEDAMRDCWATGGDVAALAGAMGRSPAALRLHAESLGLHRPAARRRWQPAEDELVRDGYDQGLTCAEIARHLPGRTPTAVAARAAKLGAATYARAWTPREELVLRQLTRDGFNLERAAQLLGRTPEAIRARTRKLGLSPLHSNGAARQGSRWTTEDDDLLRLHAALNPAALAELLDRSPEAVTQRLRRLGLRRGAERSPHHSLPASNGLTPGERATLKRELAVGGARRRVALAQRLGIRLADIRDAEAALARTGS